MRGLSKGFATHCSLQRLFRNVSKEISLSGEISFRWLIAHRTAVIFIPRKNGSMIPNTFDSCSVFPLQCDWENESCHHAWKSVKWFFFIMQLLWSVSLCFLDVSKVMHSNEAKMGKWFATHFAVGDSHNRVSMKIRYQWYWHLGVWQTIKDASKKSMTKFRKNIFGYLERYLPFITFEFSESAYTRKTKFPSNGPNWVWKNSFFCADFKNVSSMTSVKNAPKSSVLDPDPDPEPH